jgi:hypothetical protein
VNEDHPAKNEIETNEISEMLYEFVVDESLSLHNYDKLKPQPFVE